MRPALRAETRAAGRETCARSVRDSRAAIAAWWSVVEWEAALAVRDTLTGRSLLSSVTPIDHAAEPADPGPPFPLLAFPFYCLVRPPSSIG